MSLGMADRLELTGFVEDVTEILSRLTVFVMATYRDGFGFGAEGLSGAMVEASWAGLPVVATRGGGSPEGMREGVTGTLAEPSDPADLARGIAPYLRDAELAAQCGRGGIALRPRAFCARHGRREPVRRRAPGHLRSLRRPDARTGACAPCPPRTSRPAG